MNKIKLGLVASLIATVVIPFATHAGSCEDLYPYDELVDTSAFVASQKVKIANCRSEGGLLSAGRNPEWKNAPLVKTATGYDVDLTGTEWYKNQMITLVKGLVSKGYTVNQWPMFAVWFQLVK